MRRPLIIWPSLSMLSCMLALFGFSQPQKTTLKNDLPPKGIAVVELFTSEGCSSCPPADETVASLVKDYPLAVFVLGFHVDYWNYLGWKDVFSNADYSKRQEQYAAVFALSSIYTPQVVVNGKYQFTGSDKRKLYSAVEKELSTAVSVPVELLAKAVGKDIQVSYKALAVENAVLRIALVQSKASSAVQNGENRGKQLHHIDVVRDFKSAVNSEGLLILHLPEGLSPKNCRVVAYLQHKSDFSITGATSCSIQ